MAEMHESVNWFSRDTRSWKEAAAVPVEGSKESNGVSGRQSSPPVCWYHVYASGWIRFGPDVGVP